MDAFIPLAVNFAVLGVVILIVVVLVLLFNAARARFRQPALVAVFDALGEFALKAVYGAENIAYTTFTQLDSKLDSLDKKQIADAVYDTLPDTIFVGGRPVPIGFIKALVTREMWQALVQRKFGEADAFLEKQRTYLIKQIDGLADQLGHPDPPSAPPSAPDASAVG